MKVTVNINGKDTEIELTADQVQKVKKATEKITDRIKTFSDVLQVVPEKRRDEWAEACVNLDTQGVANEKVKLITEVLNEGVEMDPFNENQYKYYPYFTVKNNAFVFHSYCGDWVSGTNVGSRLCFKSSELAIYAGKQFIDIYNNLLK
jgi:cell division protein ZapA (FtsZ GTPase activity inhibitor)